MAASAVSSDDTQDSGPLPIVGTPADVPEWLAARRQRIEPTSATPVTGPRGDKSADVVPLSVPAPGRKTPRVSVTTKPDNLVLQTEAARAFESEGHWFVRWISNHTTIGVLVSLFVHTVVLSILAFILISKVTSHDGIDLWGILGESQELGTDTVLDTSLPDAGGDSPPLEIATISESLETLGVGSQIPEPLRMQGMGGNGKGEGDAGEGMSIGVASPKIPGYAQSKGHFSAWTDPRDPKPRENYSIVVHIRLPKAVRKYRGSDLTGLVTGTDRYSQKIRFKASEQFDIDDGAVEIRIPVPGGETRVRDTIFVESKLLREKQTFEIEF